MRRRRSRWRFAHPLRASWPEESEVCSGSGGTGLHRGTSGGLGQGFVHWRFAEFVTRVVQQRADPLLGEFSHLLRRKDQAVESVQVHEVAPDEHAESAARRVSLPHCLPRAFGACRGQKISEAETMHGIPRIARATKSFEHSAMEGSRSGSRLTSSNMWWARVPSISGSGACTWRHASRIRSRNRETSPDRASRITRPSPRCSACSNSCRLGVPCQGIRVYGSTGFRQ